MNTLVWIGLASTVTALGGLMIGLALGYRAARDDHVENDELHNQVSEFGPILADLQGVEQHTSPPLSEDVADIRDRLQDLQVQIRELAR